MPRNIQTKDITEFTDDDGKKWVPTSTADLFSAKEFSDILKTIEQEKEPGDVVKVHIDVQKVNKEYYEAAVALQEKVNKQTEMLKKIAVEVNATMEKKNKKLKELIAYIRNLHQFISYINNNISDEDRLKLQQYHASLPPISAATEGSAEPKAEAPASNDQPKKASIYEDVVEEILKFEN